MTDVYPYILKALDWFKKNAPNNDGVLNIHNT